MVVWLQASPGPSLAGRAIGVHAIHIDGCTACLLSWYLGLVRPTGAPRCPRLTSSSPIPLQVLDTLLAALAAGKPMPGVRLLISCFRSSGSSGTCFSQQCTLDLRCCVVISLAQCSVVVLSNRLTRLGGGCWAKLRRGSQAAERERERERERDTGASSQLASLFSCPITCTPALFKVVRSQPQLGRIAIL